MSHGSYGEFHPNSIAYLRLNTHHIPTIAQAHQHRIEWHRLSLFRSVGLIKSRHLQLVLSLPWQQQPDAKSSHHLWRLSWQFYCAGGMSFWFFQKVAVQLILTVILFFERWSRNVVHYWTVLLLYIWEIKSSTVNPLSHSWCTTDWNNFLALLF